MITNFDRLRSTVRHVQKLWQDELRCQEKNAVHEGAWSMQVIEPVLAALEWPRLRREGLMSTGAYFEWPDKHKVDVALLEEGRPRAYFELKAGHGGCCKDLFKQLSKHDALADARFGVASWFAGDAGFFQVHEVGPACTLTPSPIVTLADACDDPSPLARLAAPVLMNQVADPSTWLNATTGDLGPFGPRCSTRDVQRRFFSLLARKLGIDVPLQPRRACTNPDPPTPSYAFVELPGVLPSAWGLVLDIDTTTNQLQSFFFRNSNRMTCKSRTPRSFDNGDLSDAALESFLNDEVIPIIELWKPEIGHARGA